MVTFINPRWDSRKKFLIDRWPLLTENDLHTLEKHPENIIIKLQKLYHYTKLDAYDAYFEMMNAEKDPTLTSPQH
jgi:hypothetical protein